MAIKSRPKGGYKDLLNMPMSEISKASDADLRGMVAKLNDVANKRLGRLGKSGLGSLSGAYRSRGGKKFTSKGLKTREDVLTAYHEARNFLKNNTSSVTYSKGLIEQYRSNKNLKTHTSKLFDQYERILGKPLDDPSNFDRRYKKSMKLKKSVSDRLSKFWKEYNKWKEIREREGVQPKNPGGNTNEEDVEEFVEKVWNKGKRGRLSEYEKTAKEIYLERERELEENDENAYEDLPLQPIPAPKPKRGGKGKAKQNKHKAKGGEDLSRYMPQVRFESIAIPFDDDDGE